TSRAGSCPREATDASASGKLAPHRIAAGNTTQSDRTRSSWKLNKGVLEIEGSIGHQGNDSVNIYAAQAMVAQSRTWHQARATRGRFIWWDSEEPIVLPIPRPIRKTATIIENVYTVAP